MKDLFQSVRLTTTMLVGAGMLNASAALLVGPVYPAPGGNGFSSSGVSPANGIRTFSYSGFNAGSFSELYWGPSAFAPVTSFLSRGGGPMTFAGISGLTATWMGTASYLDNFLVLQSTSTRFLATVNSAATPWVTASTIPGFTAAQAISLGAVINDSAGLNYSVDLQFQALVGSSWIPLNQFNNLYDHGGGSSSSFSGGFYYAAPVPEPTTMIAGALLLLPFGASTVRFFRKQRSAQKQQGQSAKPIQ